MAKRSAANEQPKYRGRTVEQWFQAIREGETESPKVMAVFREASLGSKARDAVPFLIECLDDPKTYRGFNLRYVAADALGRIGKAAAPAIDKLQNLAATDTHVRNYAYEALARIDPEACGLPYWIDALQEKDDYIVRTAATALGRIGPRAADAVEPLGIAATANVKFGLPQNLVLCVEALVRIAPEDPRVVEFLDFVAKKFDIAAGIKGMLAVGTPAAVKKLERVLYFNPSDLTGLSGHRVKKLLDKVESTFKGFRFLCPECDQPMGTGDDRFCARCAKSS